MPGTNTLPYLAFLRLRKKKKFYEIVMRSSDLKDDDDLQFLTRFWKKIIFQKKKMTKAFLSLFYQKIIKNWNFKGTNCQFILPVRSLPFSSCHKLYLFQSINFINDSVPAKSFNGCFLRKKPRYDSIISERSKLVCLSLSVTSTLV